MQRERFYAFTLVELLVVVAIISVLMSVMLPSLTRAQRQGEQVHCLANHHQLMLGWIQYATDNDDRICDPNGSGDLRSLLRPFVPDEAVFICESLKGSTKEDCYGLSNTMGGKTRDGIVPYRKWHNVRQAADRLVFADVTPRLQPWIWPVLRDGDQWYWRPWSWPASTSLQGLTARHGGGFNRSFADGHADYYRYSDTRTTKLIAGRLVDSNEASLDNADLTAMLRVLKHL